MTKTQMIERIAQELNTTKKTVSDVLDAITSVVIDTDKTIIKGFGTFEWKTTKARTCRNPKTGEPVEVPESTTLKFKASETLRNL